MKSSTCYFHITVKISADFQISISVPLIILKTSATESLYDKVLGCISVTLLKRDSITGFFLRTLTNFQNTFFIEHFPETTSGFSTKVSIQ